jgi:VWFA-related protein
MRFSRSLYVASLLNLLLPAIAALAQAPAAAPPQPATAPQSNSTAKPEPAATSTVIQTNANLVLVDVVVTDRGYPVHGLDKTLFHILEDGHEQAITSFDEHHPTPPAAGAPSPPVPLPPNTWTNVPTYPETQTVNVLLLDGLNTLLPDQMRVRQQMLDYMATIQPGTPMAIFTLSSRLRMVKGFTTNPAELTRALASRKTTPQTSVILDPDTSKTLDTSIAEMAALGANSDPVTSNADAVANMQQFLADLTALQTDQRVRITLAAMQQLARYLAGIPGRKNVIWFSGSFPIALDPDQSLQDSFEAMRNYAGDVRDTSQLLAAARVAVYPVDARGLMTLPSADASIASASTNLMSRTSNPGRGGTRQSVTANRASISNDDSKFIQQTMAEHASMQLIAEQTGGQEFINTNGFKEAVAKALDDGASYYTIGYVPVTTADNGHFHKIQVRTASGSYKLAYRRGYYADSTNKPSAHAAANNSLVMAAMLPGAPPATQIRFAARVLPATDPRFKNLKMQDSSVGEEASSLKGPLHRYIVDLKVDPHTLSFENAADGARKAAVEFVLVAYDAESRRVNHVDTGFQLSIRPDQYLSIMSSGIPVRMVIDLPQGQFSLRIAVHDLAAGRAGSLEVPLIVASR